MKKTLIIASFIFFFLTAGYIFLIRFDRLPINQSTKTCLVTGASSGIGLEISREMIKRGWKVIGVARRQEKLKELAAELGFGFIPYQCDVSIPVQIHDASDAIKKQGLQPTLFFLNAGTGAPYHKFQPMMPMHKECFDTNYFGVIAWVDEWINDVKAYGGGTFVATSSVNAIFAPPGCDGYGASKAALNGCFKSLRLRYFNDGIGFVLVLPGPVATPMLKAPKTLPFTHNATDEARYIVEQVFKGKKQIEPSWFYSCLLRILNWLPDSIVLNIF